ncbi:uncharacterized protein Tco025E_08814 [Trypanosoma conorhini]|uniref:Uncharacterized protein n=1 Tax=Trypanosoma conorhini TaxID=83891 RepID=A0A422N4G8_9TRYP|nr:uncharacterized protein Tco025E_08814 [Trypanosoma conorhini]RNF00369.1 hypothetical protein Tco025E_08814 [Trypanosoma conorhini]
MDYNLEYSEEQREYLERVGMWEHLETFVAEVVRQKPHDVYEFLHSWASARCPQAATATQTQAAIKIQCALRRHLARERMRSRQREVSGHVEHNQAQVATTLEAEA